MIEAKGVGGHDFDEALCVDAGRNARPLERDSHECDWRRGGEGDPARDMIRQLLGDGLRDVRRADEVHLLGAEEGKEGARERDGVARGCPLSVLTSELELVHS